MSESVWIAGIHMTRFGKHPESSVVDLASAAAREALRDAGLAMREMGMLAAGNVLQASSGLGQQVQKRIGQTGIPVHNVVNACATGATALRTVITAIKAGEVEAGLAVGAEKLSGAGLLAGGAETAKPERWEPHGPLGAVTDLAGHVGTDLMPGIFGLIGTEYGHRYPGADAKLFARISEKNHAHSTLNPLATYQRRYTLDEIMNDLMIAYPNTRPMCSANCDGASAAVLVSESRLRTLPLAQQRRAVKISASVMTSDRWTRGSHVLPDFSTPTRDAAAQAYEQAGIGPEDLDLVELHDCFATAELVHYDNLMLCPPGGAVELFDSGATWRDGRIPVNVSGGLQSKGHPLAATGIANVWEVAHHLRGEAGPRQIEDARVGLTHVCGLGQSCVVHILEGATR